MKKKLSDSELAARARLERARLEFVEKHGATKVKETFFKKYIDHGFVYVGINIAFWVGLIFYFSRSSN